MAVQPAKEVGGFDQKLNCYQDLRQFLSAAFTERPWYWLAADGAARRHLPGDRTNARARPAA